MLNVGEQIVSSYLRYIRGCAFTETNLNTVESQGEIDVVGLNIVEQKVYICEVAIHLTTGLKYSDDMGDNIRKLTDKFSRGIDYAWNYYKEYDHHFMLWSPIVKESKMQHLTEMQENIRRKYSIDIECIVNEKFQECLEELRNFARQQTTVFHCPLMRLMQIEESLAKHVSRITNTHKKPVFHQVTHPAIDIQTDKHPVVGYSEFWKPIREGKFGELFSGKPVPIRDEGDIAKFIRGKELCINLNNDRCYIRLWIRGENRSERRDMLKNLFKDAKYECEEKDTPESATLIFRVLDKGKNDRDDWDEIREKLVTMGTDIYNKIDESGL